jgi:hypothetical protein
MFRFPQRTMAHHFDRVLTGCHIRADTTDCCDTMAGMTNRSRRRRAAQFPVATIAAYGPDNTCATTLIVSILERPGASEARVMRTWTTETADVRSDPTLQRKLPRSFPIAASSGQWRRPGSLAALTRKASTTPGGGRARSVLSGRPSIDSRTNRSALSWMLRHDIRVQQARCRPSRTEPE